MKDSVALFSLVLLLFAAGRPVYASGTSEQDPRDYQDTVATVNGAIIPRSYWEREILRFQDRLRRQGRVIDEQQNQALAQQALDTLIDMELLYQETKRRDIVVSQEQIEEEVRSLRDRFADDAAFSAALEQMGFSVTELENELVRQLAVQELLDRDIAPTVSVLQEELRGYYEENREVFRTPAQVRARHILIRLSPDADNGEKAQALARIEEIRRRILGGEDFGELARELSQDASSVDGGDLGFFSRQQMAPAFTEAAFALSPGEISEAVRTDFGYHLIEVTERKEEIVLSFGEVELQLKEYLRHEKMMSILDGLVAELRQSAVIEKLPGGQGKD